MSTPQKWLSAQSLTSECLWFVVPGMNIPNAIYLVREACALRHFSLKSQSITPWGMPVAAGSVGEEDTADALRYLVATKARLITQRKLRGV
jgi:hypothetical protein